SGTRARNKQRHGQATPLVRCEQQVQSLFADVDPAEEQDVLTATDSLLVQAPAIDAIRDDLHFGRRAIPADSRTVGLVKRYDIPVEAQAKPFYEEKGEPVSARHLLAAEALSESQNPGAREKRQETSRKGWGKAFNPQVVWNPPGGERQQRVEQQLAASQARPPDRQRLVSHTVTHDGLTVARRGYDRNLKRG